MRAGPSQFFTLLLVSKYISMCLLGFYIWKQGRPNLGHHGDTVKPSNYSCLVPVLPTAHEPWHPCFESHCQKPKKSGPNSEIALNNQSASFSPLTSNHVYPASQIDTSAHSKLWGLTIIFPTPTFLGMCKLTALLKKHFPSFPVDPAKCPGEKCLDLNPYLKGTISR